MAAVTDQLHTAERAARSAPGRTFAMTVVGAGCLAIATGVVSLLALYGPAAIADPETAPLLFIFGTFATGATALGGVALVWAGARTRAWVWLVPAAFGLLVVVMNAGHALYDLARPANTTGFVINLLIMPGALAAIAGGGTAFREVRRGTQSWRPSGRAGLVSLALVGGIVGAAATSAVAGLASAGESRGGDLAARPDVTGILGVDGMAFAETQMTVRNGEVLGLFVVNDDGIMHSFDIDSLGIHVELPPNSTQVVAIEPLGLGTLDFDCGIPGHREAGMVGSIAVQ
jgi:uncharacterized cupredoxin-like copper-binding protein